jgi:hypothetical protein
MVKSADEITSKDAGAIEITSKITDKNKVEIADEGIGVGTSVGTVARADAGGTPHHDTPPARPGRSPLSKAREVRTRASAVRAHSAPSALSR